MAALSNHLTQLEGIESYGINANPREYTAAEIISLAQDWGLDISEQLCKPVSDYLEDFGGNDTLIAADDNVARYLVEIPTKGKVYNLQNFRMTEEFFFVDPIDMEKGQLIREIAKLTAATINFLRETGQIAKPTTNNVTAWIPRKFTDIEPLVNMLMLKARGTATVLVDMDFYSRSSSFQLQQSLNLVDISLDDNPFKLVDFSNPKLYLADFAYFGTPHEVNGPEKKWLQKSLIDGISYLSDKCSIELICPPWESGPVSNVYSILSSVGASRVKFFPK
jgi:protein-tyrosine-phosphatase